MLLSIEKPLTTALSAIKGNEVSKVETNYIKSPALDLPSLISMMRSAITIPEQTM